MLWSTRTSSLVSSSLRTGAFEKLKLGCPVTLGSGYEFKYAWPILLKRLLGILLQATDPALGVWVPSGFAAMGMPALHKNGRFDVPSVVFGLLIKVDPQLAVVGQSGWI